jgi:hypothetical protein
MNPARLVAAAALGTAFGLSTSLANDLGSREGAFGAVAGVASFVLDAGWAWAAVAVLAGALAAGLLTAATAGAVALVAAVGAYFAMDAVLREESLSLYGPEMARWWAVSLIAGPALGLVGALARRPGALGLVAALVVPAGAMTQMLLFPPGGGALVVTDEQEFARAIVVVAALSAAAALATRFVLSRRVSSRHPVAEAVID